MWAYVFPLASWGTRLALNLPSPHPSRGLLRLPRAGDFPRPGPRPLPPRWPQGKTGLQASHAADHRRDYGFPKYTHDSEEEAEATIEQGHVLQPSQAPQA